METFETYASTMSSIKSRTLRSIKAPHSVDCLCLSSYIKLLYCAVDWNANVAYDVCLMYFVQEGISGTWTSGWILAQKRTLFYCVQDGTLQEADVRKARCIVE